MYEEDIKFNLMLSLFVSCTRIVCHNILLHVSSRHSGCFSWGWVAEPLQIYFFTHAYIPLNALACSKAKSKPR